MSGLIALHLGAGYHAEKKRKAYRSICFKACKAAVKSLKLNASAVEVVCDTVAMLEDSSLTNAGIGSNLTMNGTVECDAAVMDGKSLNFGSVGSLYGIRNPIKVAQSVLEEQNKGLLSHGRIPPCTLVGKGAVQWAKEHRFDLVDPNLLISDNSKKNFIKGKSLLDRTDPLLANCEQELLDTVGGLCIDMDGNVASAVSSGGLVLKHSGRVGQASIFGAGCWAQNGNTPSDAAIAVSVSGVGEYLIKTLLAKECYDGLSHSSDSFSALPDLFKTKFIESPYLKNTSSKFAGVLSLMHYHQDNFSELSWAHNTNTFLISYMSVLDNKPHCLVSEQPSASISCENVIFSGQKILHYEN